MSNHPDAPNRNSFKSEIVVVMQSDPEDTPSSERDNPTTTSVAVNSPDKTPDASMVKTDSRPPVVEEPESPTTFDVTDVEKHGHPGVSLAHEMQNDIFIKKLELKVSGFIDLSGLIATFGILVLLLSQPTRNEYFLPVLVFIFISMILQCMLALILVVRHNSLDSEAQVVSNIESGHGGHSEERNWYIRESRRLLTFSSISLIFITILNILIATFAGLAGASKGPPDCLLQNYT